ncbi:MAG: hypothetical protein DRP56_00885 [Planctomycetota bacterium]|nr:MAG: hypothetical protein DRP56_00885 [Planctomycetota bacterium]RLB91229.1 MAG: hypothetical protein DRH10_02385 [Deltaproteobacteria bacterium]
MGATYDIAAGLDALVPSANYSGRLKYNTQQEYDALVWADERSKPSFSNVDAATLNVMRLAIVHDINERTSSEITGNFRSSIAPSTPIFSTLEWQFDVLNLWLIRDSGIISFPYELYCSTGDNAESNYISLPDSTALNTMYLEMFGYVDGWLKSGRSEKDKLKMMDKEQLETYTDPR